MYRNCVFSFGAAIDLTSQGKIIIKSNKIPLHLPFQHLLDLLHIGLSFIQVIATMMSETLLSFLLQFGDSVRQSLDDDLHILEWKLDE